ncbi:MAG: hypothetical protein ACR2MF_09680 [Chthoniobacterales bacterium]
MMDENGACMTGVAKITGTAKSDEISADYRVIDVFEKKDGECVGVASQVTRIAPDKK